MSLRSYVWLWIFIAVLLSYEATALNQFPELSILGMLRAQLPALAELNLSPEPGKTISLWYGWTGFSLMLLTNLYILRKRWSPLRKLGSMTGWLDFHIFCGLVGPTFILFHTNFKIGGLVAISFWSMVVSFASGIVGRYFYLQAGRHKAELEQEAGTQEQLLHRYFEPVAMERLRAEALLVGGASATGGAVTMGTSAAVFTAIAGDLRLWWKYRSLKGRLPSAALNALKRLAKTRRRIGLLSQFEAVMGYWHSFHMPFAVFMYTIALIHIATALLFKV